MTLVRGVARATLLRDGHTVLEAVSVSSGCAAGDSYTGEIDLLITDHRLLDGLGRQIAAHLLKTRPGLKVLHTSGYPRELILDDEGLTPGAAFLAKPFLPKAMAAAVNALLAPSAAVGPHR
jgi:DNA-binding response OmpR family regulator